MVPGDVEIFRGNSGGFDVLSVRRRNKVRHLVEVVHVEGVGEVRESFAYALLLTKHEVRSPAWESPHRVGRKTVLTSLLAEQHEVVGKLASEASLVTARFAVELQVVHKTVSEGLRRGQTNAERVKKASLTNIVDTGVVETLERLG